MTVPVRFAIAAFLAVGVCAATVGVRAQDAVVTGVTPVATTPSVETLFADAAAKETAVRKALSAPKPPETLLKAVRTVIEEYETLATRYPASSQADDALWRGGKLAADAFAEFHDAHERTAALRLFQTLTTQFPRSRFAKQTASPVSALRAATPRALHTEPVSSSEAGVSAPPVASAAVGPSIPAAAPPPPAAATPAKTTHVPKPIPQPARTTTQPTKLATIKDIRRVTMHDVVRVVIEVDREVAFHDEHIDGPSRVFVDLPATQATAALKDQTLRFDSDGDLVHQVRIGRHPGNMTRVVLDAEGVSSYSIYPLYAPYRLVIDCLRPVAATTTATPPVPAAAKPTPLLAIRHLSDGWSPDLPALMPLATAALTDARVDAIAPTPPAAPLATSTRLPAASVASTAPAAPLPAGAPSTNLTGGFSISRQLGLNVSRIVIDPGHGGHDPGAKGGGTTEAELVLDVSLRLAQLLGKIPGLEVVLTRKTDDYVPLQERTAIANRESADLFLSIHANANNDPQAQGVETYFLNFAKTLSAAAVAARENAASGQNMAELPDMVKTIALNNKLDESRDFATYVQRQMVTKLRPSNKAVRDLGVKQAPFVVLIGAAMPSVLAEVSFITNPQEARLLKSSAYRQRIAEALFEAVRTYQGSLKKVPSVARQSR